MTLSWKDERHITHRSFRIVDLVGDEYIIRGRTFEDCTIYGPAVVVPLDQIAFEHNSFDGPLEAILWEIPDEKNFIVGAIGLTDCIFRRCQFRGIGIAGNHSLIEKFVREFGEPPPPTRPIVDQQQGK